ncbi:hypothetical protein EDB86DRAFT_2917967 [Lactarius hatsudake]|nr:hypothetical protein EDB86DRAFT_2917967 [Lactarius hatsudake]
MGPSRFHSPRCCTRPDHHEAKNCTHKFDRAAEDPSPRFFGNIYVGPPTPTPTIPHALPISIFSLKGVPIPLHWLRRPHAAHCPLPIASSPRSRPSTGTCSTRHIPRPYRYTRWSTSLSPARTSSAAVRYVPIIGRRGPLQASSACSALDAIPSPEALAAARHFPRAGP